MRGRRRPMKGIANSVALIALIGLLATVLVVLWQINREGVTVHLSGQVKLVDAATGVAGEVSLVMSEPVNLIATGPLETPIPANLSVVTCPQCGGNMLPIRWSLFSGEIQWRCLECGYSTKQIPAASP
jgi:hypothetical protein